MGFEIEKRTYAGSIKPITIGKGDKAVTVGGNTCLPFYLFEGDMPNKPKIAMEVWDKEPDEWPEAAMAPFKDVLKDPAAWAKRCVEEFGADLIVLQLKSTDPNDDDASPESASETVGKVLEAINVPLVLWGTANNEKDEQVLRKISEDFEGQNLLLGPVEEPNHKGVGASALGYGQMVIASSPIDINLAKQINILLENLGVALDKMIIDPTTGGLGYGMEYSFSIMERIMLAALDQGDDKLQLPMINNLGNEVWRCKEAKETADTEPMLGDPERRDIMMEVVGAVTYLIGGSGILILRHPESVRLVRSFIDLMADGGSAQEVAPINKRLQDVDIDFSSMSPEPDLTLEEEKKPAAKKEEAPKKEEKPAEKKEAAPEKPAAKKEEAAPKKEEPKKKEPKKEEKPAAEAKPEKKETAEEKAEAEAKAKEEAEAKAKAEEEAKKKAEEEKKKKEEEEKKKKAEEEEARKKAEEEAKKQKAAEERAKRDAEEQAMREQRAREREELEKKRRAERAEKKAAKTPAAEQKDQLQKIVEMLDRVHRRV